MSAYTLNKMLREVNRNPRMRERFFESRAAVADEFELTEAERMAFLQNDIGALYRFGVHGLILRPFTLLQNMPEPDYLRAIRGEAQ